MDPELQTSRSTQQDTRVPERQCQDMLAPFRRLPILSKQQMPSAECHLYALRLPNPPKPIATKRRLCERQEPSPKKPKQGEINPRRHGGEGLMQPSLRFF